LAGKPLKSLTSLDRNNNKTLRIKLAAGAALAGTASQAPAATDDDAELELMAAKIQQLVEQALEFDQAHNDVECERCDCEARKLQERIFQLPEAGPRGLLAKLRACLPGYAGANLPYYGDFSEDSAETLCVSSIYRDLRRLTSLHDTN
jgi:hypothetical protein